MKYKITLSDFLKAQAIHNRLVLRLYPILMGVLLFVIAVQLLSSQLDMFSIMFFLIWLVLPFFSRFQLKKVYRSQKTLQEEISFTFDDQEFCFESPSGSFRSKWEDLYKSRIGKNHILLYEAKNLMRIVPAQSLRDNNRYNELVSILSRL